MCSYSNYCVDNQNTITLHMLSVYFHALNHGNRQLTFKFTWEQIQEFLHTRLARSLED